MSQKWITKKGTNGENRHILINEGNKMREKEVKIPKPDNLIEEKVIEFEKAGHKFRFKNARFDVGRLVWSAEIDNKPIGNAEWVYDSKNGFYFLLDFEQNLNGNKIKGIKPLPEQNQIIEEIVKKVKEDESKEQQMLINEFKKNPPEKIYIGIGGDTGKLYINVIDKKIDKIKDSKEFSDWMKLMEKALEKIFYSSSSLDEFMSKLNIQKSNIRTGLYNTLYDGGYWGIINLDNEIIQNTIKEIKQKQRSEEEERIRLSKQRERENNEAIEKAKKLNKEVYIRKIGNYEGEGEEGLVIIWEVATPDGRIIEKHIPTY